MLCELFFGCKVCKEIDSKMAFLFELDWRAAAAAFVLPWYGSSKVVVQGKQLLLAVLLLLL